MNNESTFTAKNSKIFQSVANELKNIKMQLDANATIKHPVIDKIKEKYNK